MKALRKVFGNWWVLTAGAAVLAVLALAGLLPLVVGQLRPWPVRLGLVGLVGLVWATLALWRVLAARRASAALAKSLAGAATPGESEVLAKRMSDALTGLKAASDGRKDYLYSRPWYVIIGPPGAGKTTALLNSGLRFPFSDAALKGVGGTRNLDFWFADEAVLVDTAGRYTTQDSDADRDRTAWTAFLSLLRKNRPLQPINGVLVAIGLDELAQADVAKVDRHAAIVRRRLAELKAELQVNAPVYVMFTKADLIAGFAEFYDDLDVEGRRAVLGATLPWAPEGRSGGAALAEAFDGVCRAAGDRTSKRLQEELDARRRGLIVGFPPQLAALRSRVVRFLEGAFPSEAPEAPAALRGFYFTSGVQQGAPIERILGSMAAVYDAPVRAGGQGRAYFVNRLLQEVVVGEAGLVQTSPEARRRRTGLMAAGLAAVGVVSALVLAAWAVSFVGNRGLQNQLFAGARGASQEIQVAGLDLVEVHEDDPDLEAALSVLRKLRALPRGYVERAGGGPPLTMGFGLHQSGLSRTAEETYLEALRRILLPRVLLALERRLQEAQSDPLALYEPLKVYLSLGGHSPSGLDTAAVRSWALGHWAETEFAGADREPLRKELAQHLDALLGDPSFSSVWEERRAPLDAALIDRSRASLQTLSLDQRAYALLAQKASAEPDWRVEQVLEPGQALAFLDGEAVRAQAVPYFYTRDGFERAYQLGLRDLQGELERDLWVLGGDQDRASLRAQMRMVRPGVAELYARDYIEAWERVVGSLQPASYFNDAAAFRAATANPSPLELVLGHVRRQTDFTGGTRVDKATAAASKAVKGKVPALAKAGGATASGGGADAGRIITAHYKPLHDYVGDGKTPGPVTEFIAKLRAAAVAKIAADSRGAGPGGDQEQSALNQAMAELKIAADSAPTMLQEYAAPAAAAGGEARVSSATGAITGSYEATVAPECLSVTEGRYPFVSASASQAPLGDVVRVFGMNGSLDAYVQARVRPMVDTAGPVWRWRMDDPVAANFDPTTAGEFQKAVEIRELLLSGVTARVEAVGFGGTVKSAEFVAGSATHRFEAGQPGGRSIQWNTASLPEASVTLSDGTNTLDSFAFDGPWALFRLFDAARKENTGPNSFNATFGEGAAAVTFRVTLAAGSNPFNRGGLWSFRCPPSL
jgi:type VI secretion system protein ImpL